MGSGAVGGYYGALLHRGGHNVTLVARGEHLEAIRSHGLHVESVASGEFSARPAATDAPDASLNAELVLFCVKSYDNAAAIDTMRPAVGPTTSILTIQNGIGSGAELANAFGSANVLLGVTYVDAVRTAPGMVAEVGGPTNIVFGVEDGGNTPKAEEVHNALDSSGIDVQLSTSATAALWNKLILVCGLSGMMCITRASMPEILATPETLDLTWRVMREAEAVAKAMGVAPDHDILNSAMYELEQCDENSTSSMLVDLQRGNRLEVDVLNGAVARLGSEVGVETPINGFISTCLQVADRRAASRRNATG